MAECQICKRGAMKLEGYQAGLGIQGLLVQGMHRGLRRKEAEEASCVFDE